MSTILFNKIPHRCSQRLSACFINSEDRIVNAIGKLITADIYRSVFNGVICIDKPAPSRIVIPAPQVIEPRLFIIDISTIPERLHRTESAGEGTRLADRLAPSIVLVFYYLAAVCVNQRDDVALQVVQVGVSSSLNKTTVGLFCPS